MDKILLTFLILICACSGSEDKVAEQPQPDDWMLLPFNKQEEFFPVLETDTSSFFCPVNKRMVRWQDSYVFNPAAIVRNGKVYLLYRGEDTIGRFGGTSRIGIAESDDGVHFKKNPLPVLFPENDDILEFEKEGGCEDPIMYGSESFPLEAYDYWMAVVDNPWVIGDFVWTGYDYLGEASIGWLGYPHEGSFYPWTHAYCGDIDICGWKRPQSYYSDALWKDNQLSMFVKPPKPSFESPRAHWLRRARKLGSPLLAAESASIKKLP